MIRVQRWKVTFSQSMLFLWTLVLSLATFLFLHFIYSPLQRHLSHETERVYVLEKRLDWLDQIIRSAQDEDQAMTAMKISNRALERKFPDSEHRSLAMLSAYAPKFRIQMRKIQADPPQPFRGSRGTTLAVDQKTCSYVYVRMNMRADFKNLVKYLDAMRQTLPAYMTVERLEAETRSEEPHLDVTANMALFLLER